MNKKQDAGLTIVNKGGEIQIVVPSNNSLVLALQTKRIFEATDKQIVTYLSAAIEKGRFDLGLNTDKITPKDNLLFIQSVLTDLKDNFKALTIGEIPVAIYNFTRGKYTAPGKDVFFTPASISKGFTAYMMDQNRQQAKKELLMLQEPTEEELTPSEEEVEEGRLKIIRKSFEDFKDTGAYEDHFNYVYQAIESYQPIPFDKAKKLQVYEQARLELIAENKGNYADKHDREKKRMKVKLLELIHVKDIQMTEALEKVKLDVKVKSMKIALTEFYKQLIKNNQTISEFIDK